MTYPITNKSYEQCLIYICKFFDVKLFTKYRKKIDKKYFIIRVENQKSIKIMIKYLNKYKLQTSKYLDFKDWEKGFEEIRNKRHFTDQGRIIVQKHKNNMNNKRIIFNWKHLIF